MTRLFSAPWHVQDREARIAKWIAATPEQRAEHRQLILEALESPRDSQMAEGLRGRLSEMDEVETRLQEGQNV